MGLKELLTSTPEDFEMAYNELKSEVIALLNKLAADGKLGGVKTQSKSKNQLEISPPYERHPAGPVPIRPIGRKNKTWDDMATEVGENLSHFIPRFSEYIAIMMSNGFTDADIVDALLCVPSSRHGPQRRISLHNAPTDNQVS